MHNNYANNYISSVFACQENDKMGMFYGLICKTKKSGFLPDFLLKTYIFNIKNVKNR